MEKTHEVGWRPFMPASTLSGRSVALLRVRLDDCTPSEGQLISHGNCARSWFFGRSVPVAERYRFISLIPGRHSGLGSHLTCPLIPVVHVAERYQFIGLIPGRHSGFGVSIPRYLTCPSIPN